MQLEEHDVKLLLKAVTAASPEGRAMYRKGVTVASIKFQVSDYKQFFNQHSVFFAMTQQQVLYAGRDASANSMLHDFLYCCTVPNTTVWLCSGCVYIPNTSGCALSSLKPPNLHVIDLSAVVRVGLISRATNSR